jgi:hypothetical protein
MSKLPEIIDKSGVKLNLRLIFNSILPIQSLMKIRKFIFIALSSRPMKYISYFLNSSDRQCG